MRIIYISHILKCFTLRARVAPCTYMGYGAEVPVGRLNIYGLFLYEQLLKGPIPWYTQLLLKGHMYSEYVWLTVYKLRAYGQRVYSSLAKSPG